jgi:hypothetical protein
MQPRALGRKVSDEFVVPLCRIHHRQVHRSGDELHGGNKRRSTPSMLPVPCGAGRVIRMIMSAFRGALRKVVKSNINRPINRATVVLPRASFSTRVIAVNGVSGVHTGLAERPEGNRLFDKLRKGDVLVVRWVDRLPRNYQDVVDTIRVFMRRGVVIRTVIYNFTLAAPRPIR